MSGPYTRDDVGRKALMYVGDVAHDVLVLRETRGRYQVRLPEGADHAIRFRSGFKWLTLRVGETTSVPISSVELR